MTKTYEYTFRVMRCREGADPHDQSSWYQEPVTLRKRVTDRMEERPAHKAGYAANYFNDVLRTEYGYRRSPVTATAVKEV